MDREIVLVALALFIVGPLLILAGWWPTRSRTVCSGVLLERQCWYRLWLPLLPAALGLCALTGWALIEPADAEPLPLLILVTVIPLALIWTRAIARALRAFLVRPAVATAATVGLWRPRIVIGSPFRRAIDGAALRAVLRHEEAHAEHRDPLRLWLAQLATDLQWPSAPARMRFARWHHALELARDEEARRDGVDGADLAAAILTAISLESRTLRGVVLLIGDPILLRDRVDRLLGPLPVVATDIVHEKRVWRVVAPVLLAATALGIVFGESVIRVILRVMA